MFTPFWIMLVLALHSESQISNNIKCYSVSDYKEVNLVGFDLDYLCPWNYQKRVNSNEVICKETGLDPLIVL